MIRQIYRKIIPEEARKRILWIRYCIQFYWYRFMFILLSCMPKKNKVVASTFGGRKYGDNPQFILEALHQLNPDVEIVWIKDPSFNYILPDWIRCVEISQGWLPVIYEYATARVWIDTHRLRHFFYKRKSQLFIETWHGGLGIKKLDRDVPKFKENVYILRQIQTTTECADFFVSNSSHLSRIYRSAFNYTGKIWKCGYPKNDVLFSDPEGAHKNIRTKFKIPAGAKIVLYAPTFRDYFTTVGPDWSVYDIDYASVIDSFEQKSGETWYFFVKYHPFLLPFIKNRNLGVNVINASNYADMQELILASDAFISDYSSCIFDAALRNIPCFTFATDFEDYKADRGVYYEMDELPFPYARDNYELLYNIEHFNYDNYIQAWNTFKVRTGLHETGHAAFDIANVINEYVRGNTEILETIHNE